MPREKRGLSKKRAPSAPSGGQGRVGRSRSVAPVPAPAAIQDEGGSSATTAARSTPSSSVASQVTPAASHPVVSAVGPSAPSTNQVAPHNSFKRRQPDAPTWAVSLSTLQVRDSLHRTLGLRIGSALNLVCRLVQAGLPVLLFHRQFKPPHSIH